MYLEIVTTVTVLLVAGLIVKQQLSMSRQQRNQLKKGIALIKHLQRVIGLTQKHRGISNAIQQGNASLKPQLVSIQGELEHLITEGSRLDLSLHPQWESFIEHWPRLKKHSLTYDLKPLNLIRQHNMMIESQLSLFDDLTRYYKLYTMMLDSFSHASELCLDMLRAAEIVAQTRGIGAGVCAKGICDGVDKITLNFLRLSVANSTNDLIHELNTINNPVLTKQLKHSLTIIEQSLDRLVYVIDHQVSVDGNTKITAKDYFAIASTPIDELLNVFNKILSFASQHYANS